jgi:hypothetical protein
MVDVTRTDEGFALAPRPLAEFVRESCEVATATGRRSADARARRIRLNGAGLAAEGRLMANAARDSHAGGRWFDPSRAH